MIKLILGDSLEKLKELDEESVDSVVCDPPYELGFMGKSWDSTGIANNPRVWAECLRVLKPGGYLLAFSGTRTYHRMAVAIEDSGFEIRDMIEWVYGSGFPKSLNIGKAVDKLQGNDREVAEYIAPDGKPRDKVERWEVGQKANRRNGEVSKGTSEWEGWGTALKPAHEPICMARKPLTEKTVALNVLKHGTGGINIDESRVGTETIRRDNYKSTGKQGSISLPGEASHAGEEYTTTFGEGRFPANLIHDNSEEVRECFPETKIVVRISEDKDEQQNTWSLGRTGTTPRGHNDSGNASRFFKSIIYQAKASKSGRGEGNNHPTVKPIALMEYLIKMVTPKGGTVLDPFMGSGSTGVASKQNGYSFIGIDMTEDYIKIAEARIGTI